jgi:hypothetical protein
MTVNPTNGPRTLNDRVMRILEILDLPVRDVGIQERVKTFVVCNGFEGVYHAAALTASKAAEQPGVINDPWAYTVQVYNRNLARLSYLYTLSHWAESGLRSQVDQYYTDTLGASWHRDPRTYLEGRQINSFVQETKTLISWEEISGAIAMRVAAPMDPASFLERVSLAWLTQMALNAHRKGAHRILVPRDGRSVDYLRIKALLENAVTARNSVAHNRLIRRTSIYNDYEKTLLDLLVILRFDVARALRRLEMGRASLVSAAIDRLNST